MRTMRQLLATARDSARALSTGSALWNKNAQDIDRLNSMIRQKLLEMEELEKKRIEDAKKLKLADFTRPILLTLGISSIVYFSYHLLWWNLEYDEREAVLKGKHFDPIMAQSQGKMVLTPAQNSSGRRNWSSRVPLRSSRRRLQPPSRGIDGSGSGSGERPCLYIVTQYMSIVIILLS